MEATNGRRVTFQQLATTTPKLLVGAGDRQCVFINNNTSVNINLGVSGTANGLILGAGLGHYDMFSSDEWWVTTASSSGTVSGYVVA